MRRVSVITLAAMLLGGTNGCAYTSFKNLNARGQTTPIEPPSARMASRFCLERALEYSRRERSHRSQSDSGFIAAVVGVGAAAGTGFAAGKVAGGGTEKALETISVSSMIVGAIGIATASYMGFRAHNAAKEAEMVGAKGVQIWSLTERLRTARAALASAEAVRDAAQLREQRAEKERDDALNSCGTAACSGNRISSTRCCKAVQGFIDAHTAFRDAEERHSTRQDEVLRLQEQLEKSSMACFDSKPPSPGAQPPTGPVPQPPTGPVPQPPRGPVAQPPTGPVAQPRSPLHAASPLVVPEPAPLPPGSPEAGGEE